ncbi:HET-domain-containing protein [Massarina eburnea CBS 473.64]|uniref:HET-domain-containing protein n=1 Tax=Massarina eburnea CBS 473.64 TaxID=1395130 RepID=A0A6A6RUM4_9PLEO|nr:HET-domain-containing protein [Massarina eburnea CBS 473.64]
MTTEPISLMLSQHGESRIREATEAERAQKPHTCEYCARILIHIKPSYGTCENRIVQGEVEGLTSELILTAASKGCPFLTWFLSEQQDWRYFGFNNIWCKAWFEIEPGHRIRIYFMREEARPEWLREFPPWPISAATPSAFDLMRQWLRCCLHDPDHVNCSLPNRKSPDFTPRRLIEVPTSKHATSVRIIETNSKPVVWAALSYVWGGPQAMATTVSNFVNGQRVVQLHQLPNTILDAMLVAHELNINYLWVDSMCIVQDDPDDLPQELATMPQTYQGAVITIAASNSDNIAHGFLSPRTHRADSMMVAWTDDSHSSGKILLRLDEYSPEPIDRRAWTFQEKLNSPRLLSFTKNILLWDCSVRHKDYDFHELYQDHGDISTAKDVLGRSHNDYMAVKTWNAMLREYGTRKLTFPDDKLIALSAVAAEFKTDTKWTYLAGVWRNGSRLQAYWYFYRGPGNKRQRKVRAPSWSWASIDPSPNRQLMHQEPDFIPIIDAHVELCDQRLSYGNAKSGRMVIECQAVRMQVRRNRLNRWYISKTTGDRSLRVGDTRFSIVFYDHFEIYFDAPEDDFDNLNSSDIDVHIIRVAHEKGESNVGLILNRVSGPDKLWQRVGLWSNNSPVDSKVRHGLFMKQFTGVVPRQMVVI